MHIIARLSPILLVPVLLAQPAFAAGDPRPRLNGVRVGHASASTGRIATAHNYAMRVERGLVFGRRTYGVSELPIVMQNQQDPVWCVPASTRAVLSAFIKNLPSQAYLALLEGTGQFGTYLDRVPAVLNHYQSRIKYEVRSTKNFTEYREQVRTDVDVYRAPLILAIDPAQAPWYLSLHLQTSNHAIVANGYAFTPRFGGIVIWDPSGLPQAGVHVVDVLKLWAAAAPLGAPVVW